MTEYEIKEIDELQNFWKYSFLVIIELNKSLICYLFVLIIKSFQFQARVEQAYHLSCQ